MCFEYASDLPRVGVAAGIAEGFVEKPVAALALRRERGRRRGALDRRVALWDAVAAH